MLMKKGVYKLLDQRKVLVLGRTVGYQASDFNRHYMYRNSSPSSIVINNHGR